MHAGAGEVGLAFGEGGVFFRERSAVCVVEFLDEHGLKAMLSRKRENAAHDRVRRIILIDEKKIREPAFPSRVDPLETLSLGEPQTHDFRGWRPLSRFRC